MEKKILKKLVLKREFISNLNNNHINQIKGGTATSILNMCNCY